jgi:hypothetical protein
LSDLQTSTDRKIMLAHFKRLMALAA